MIASDKRPFRLAVIGGGFSGSVLALKALRDIPSAEVTIIERSAKLGRGLAYGACAPFHLLNVPVSRIEVGFVPSFESWIAACGADLSPALAESDGDLASAFVERSLFGGYLQEQIQAALRTSARLKVLHATAVRLEAGKAVILDDGRRLDTDAVVLATGNLPPRPLKLGDLSEGTTLVSDPWSPGALDSLESMSAVLLVGTGLTMVDIVLKLAAAGHKGPMVAVSRHGLLPAAHRAGGHWAPFIGTQHLSPRGVLRTIRQAIVRAAAEDVPWQRVIDAVRPSVARLWDSWSARERKQFLRYLRTRWGVVRHRMAPRVAARLDALMRSGQLRVVAGRIRGIAKNTSGYEVSVATHGSDSPRFAFDHVVNCTGPRTDIREIEYPLLADLRRQGLIVPDPLGLGIETDDCAAVNAQGRASEWLFAIGALTQPAWWEITAVPEINAQIVRLVQNLAAMREHRGRKRAPLAEEFVELGAGI